MALTTRAAFDEFESKIALTDAQRTKVSTRRDSTKQLLERTFPASDPTPVSSAILIGSTARGTAVRPLDDIDMLAVFRNKDSVFETYRYDSQAFLYRIRQRIDAKTQMQNVGARGQAVRLFYNDGLHVDIAPVFAWDTGGYALPAGDKTWIKTDPPKQAVWANERQTALGNQFKAMARLVRRWNRAHSSHLGSWHSEVLVGTVFSSLGSNHRDALRKFFEWGQSRVHAQDPDGYGGDLAADLSWNQQQAITEVLERSRERAQRALDAEARDDHKEAIRLWGIVLGDEFPNYG